MAEYNVEFVESAAKEFRTLPNYMKQRIGFTIDSLCNNPFPIGVKKLHGHKRLYRVRVGQYRIVYEIDVQRKLLLVTRIRHRREAYR